MRTGISHFLSGRAALKSGFIFLFLSLAVLHFAGRIDLVTADLGRHLRNGEIFLRQHLVLTTNFYSFTSPDLPALCHHWLSGVIFYWIFERAGFTGLSLLYVLGLVYALCFFLVAAARRARFSFVALAAVLALPLMGSRVEVRPEGLSTVFLACVFYLLAEFRAGRLSSRWLALVPLVQAVWVNTHIFFFMGIFLAGVYALDLLWDEGFTRRSKFLGFVGILTLAASLVNPFGAAGIKTLFTIFHSYGYDLAENQSIVFMLKRFPGEADHLYFLGVFTAGLLVLGWRAWQEPVKRRLFVPLSLYVVFGLLAFMIVRMIAVFGFMFIFLFSDSLEQAVRGGLSPFLRRAMTRLASFAAAGTVATGIFSDYSYFSPLKRFAPFLPPERADFASSYYHVLFHPAYWAGLRPGMYAAAHFWKTAGMKGPVFNNYDIGGYLIFHLYPQERVFVDNRPEAYSVSFFRDLYIPMQEDEALWEKALETHKFQAIFFYRHDQTPWAQPFLLRRIADDRWAPVYVDDQVIILARRHGLNDEVIRRYELPKALFRSRPQ
jgi:hypothetical protein